MKLYPIIYEGARTSEEALSKGVAAYKSNNNIILFSIERVINVTKKFVEKYPSDVRESHHNEMLGTELAKRSIVAEISTKLVDADLYKVADSAGVNKFGPLVYQLAMADIHPKWLMSDTSLTVGKDGTGGSSDVWNKMYALSEKGIYERIWLGEYKPNSFKSPLLARMDATPKSRDLFVDYTMAYGTSEEGIEAFLEDHERISGYSPYNFGFLYAYRLANPESVEVTNLYNAGDKVVETMKMLGIDDPDGVLLAAAYEFFERRYDPVRS